MKHLMFPINRKVIRIIIRKIRGGSTREVLFSSVYDANEVLCLCGIWAVYKDDGKKKSSKDKEEKIDSVKCYFVRMESFSPHEKESYILHDKKVHEARCHFMHVHMVSSMAKYMARFAISWTFLTFL